MAQEGLHVSGVFKPLATLTLWVAGAALIGMVLTEGWQVIARYVLNDSPSWTEPVALLLINVAMMMSAAVGVRNGKHFGFNVLVELTPPNVHRVFNIAAQLITALIAVALVWYGATLSIDGWSIKLAGAELPQGAMYVPMCMGGALMLLFSIEGLLRKPNVVEDHS